MVTNAAHDRRRRQGNRARAAQGWGDWEIDRRAGDDDTREQLEWLHAAMQSLPDDLRDTLALVFDGLSHREAAEVLEISEGTVSWRLSEVRRRLRDLKTEEEVS